MYYMGKDMNLRVYMQYNNKLDKDNIYYNETFCNVVLDYLGSCEPTKEDCMFLNENDYSIEDFLQEDL